MIRVWIFLWIREGTYINPKEKHNPERLEIMGILKNIFIQSPEKHEQKGDTFFNHSDWGRAKIEYENALTKLEKTASGYDESGARLQGKLCQTKEALALEHSQTGKTLMEQAYYDDARSENCHSGYAWLPWPSKT